MNDKPTFKEVLNGIEELLEHKNKNYGESALKPLEIFSKIHPYGVRIDEKVARIKNQENPSEDDIKNNLVDIVGGIVLILKDFGYTKFT